MKFGDTPIDEADGAILAHSVRLEKAVLKKGRVLSTDDIDVLRQAGRTSVVAARLEAGDVGEDAAAAALAAAARGANVTASAAFTGRCNLFAELAGLLVVDRERLDAINRVDEALTVATVPPYALVEPRDMLATIKVIPFAVRQEVVDRCAAIAAEGGPLLHVATLRKLSAGLILSSTPGMKPSILDRTVQVPRSRIEALGGTLAPANVIRCDHGEDEVAGALDRLYANDCGIVMVSGASAIVDRRDIIPAAITRTGGEIDHFGMPVDPGNLILLAHRGPVPVLGLPGCARSPAFNGFDWILQRLFAGLPLGRAEVMGMGAGGLLKEIASRPLPRKVAVSGRLEPEAAVAREPRVAAIILAAGQSRRMGGVNKLLADIEGAPMVARVAEAVAASKAAPVVVVTGHQPNRLAEALADREFRFVHNPDYAEGLSTSLKHGLAALPDDLDGALICLGDMPFVSPAHLDKLIAAYDPVEGRAICVPTFNGKRGNPVLWDRRYFAAMAEVAGDVGARHLIGENEEAVCEVAVADDGVLVDLDTPDALARQAARGAES